MSFILRSRCALKCLYLKHILPTEMQQPLFYLNILISHHEQKRKHCIIGGCKVPNDVSITKGTLLSLNKLNGSNVRLKSKKKKRTERDELEAS